MPDEKDTQTMPGTDTVAIIEAISGLQHETNTRLDKLTQELLEIKVDNAKRNGAAISAREGVDRLQQSIDKLPCAAAVERISSVETQIRLLERQDRASDDWKTSNDKRWDRIIGLVMEVIKYLVLFGVGYLVSHSFGG